MLELTAEQHEAVDRRGGSLFLHAGAGSGKTRVLVHRVAHLIETRKAWPREIFAVTFTNKAAGEMRHRLASLIGPQINEAWIGTFHSMAGRMRTGDVRPCPETCAWNGGCSYPSICREES